jgi:hypothetical protein
VCVSRIKIRKDWKLELELELELESESEPELVIDTFNCRFTVGACRVARDHLLTASFTKVGRRSFVQ